MKFRIPDWLVIGLAVGIPFSGLVLLADAAQVPYNGTPNYSNTAANIPPYAAGTAPAVATITAGGTAQTLFAAGSVKNGCWIQNPPSANETLYVDEIASAGSTSKTSIALTQGGYYKCDFIPTGTITVEAATTGHAFTAAAW